MTPRRAELWIWNLIAWQQKASNLRFRTGLGGVCAVGELAATGVAGGAVLRRSGWFDAGLIHSSAESLH